MLAVSRVELACVEFRRAKELLHQPRLADSGLPLDEDERGRMARRLEQGGEFLLPAHQSRGERPREHVRHSRRLADAPLCAPQKTPRSSPNVVRLRRRSAFRDPHCTPRCPRP